MTHLGRDPESGVALDLPLQGEQESRHSSVLALRSRQRAQDCSIAGNTCEEAEGGERLLL